MVTQSASIIQSELQVHASQDGRALGFLAADLAVFVLLPTLAPVTAVHYWWLVLVVFGLASMVLAYSLLPLLWTGGSGQYQMGPVWTEYWDALPDPSVSELEANLELVRQLTKAVQDNWELFNRKLTFFNGALVLNLVAGIVAFVVFVFR